MIFDSNLFFFYSKSSILYSYITYGHLLHSGTAKQHYSGLGSLGYPYFTWCFSYLRRSSISANFLHFYLSLASLVFTGCCYPINSVKAFRYLDATLPSFWCVWPSCAPDFFCPSITDLGRPNSSSFSSSYLILLPFGNLLDYVWFSPPLFP